MSSRRKKSRSRSRARASNGDAPSHFTWDAVRAETLRLVVRDLGVSTKAAPRTREGVVAFIQSVQANGLSVARAQLDDGASVASSAAGSGFPFPWEELTPSTLRAVIRDAGAPTSITMKSRTDMIDFIQAAESTGFSSAARDIEMASQSSVAPSRSSRKRPVTPEIELTLTPAPTPKRGRKLVRNASASGSSTQIGDAVDEKPKIKPHKPRGRTRSLSRSGSNVIEVDLSLEDVEELLAREPASAYLDVVSLQPRKLDDGAVYQLLSKNIHRVRRISCVDMSAVISDVLENYVAPVLEELRMSGEDVFPLSAFSPEAPRLSRLYLPSVDRLVLPAELWSNVTVFSVQHVQTEPSPKGILRVINALAPTIEILRIPCGLTLKEPLPASPSITLNHLEDLALSGPANYCAFVLKGLEFPPFVTILYDASYRGEYSPHVLDLDRRIGLVDLIWGNTISAAPTRTLAVSYAAPRRTDDEDSSAQLSVHAWQYETVIDGVPDFRISQDHPSNVRADVTGVYDLGYERIPQYAVYNLLLPVLALETACILSLRLEPHVKNFGHTHDDGPHPGSACWDATLWSVPFSQARQLSHLRVIAPGAASTAVELVGALVDDNPEALDARRPPSTFLLPALRTLTLAHMPANSMSLSVLSARTAVQAVRELIEIRAREGVSIRVYITAVNAEDRTRWDTGLAAVSDFVKLS
ncbi:hypothetical protein PENSPDRAFT_692044 [Peniophora sp. CONT]|nr:hypothetical protein PENSPDRAFT_692044 [Peniophora sp. CONT]